MRAVVGLSGNTHKPSKTRALVQGLLDQAEKEVGAATVLYDVIGLMPELGACLQRSEAPKRLEEALQVVENADALIVGSPTYKGSYSGLFKHLVDLLDPSSLLEKPVLICATGGGHRHALVVEHQLRPLFGFFGAATVPLAVYASDQDTVDGRFTAAIGARCTTAVRQLSAMLSVSRCQREAMNRISA